MVRNVIYLLHACKHPERLCVSWSVSNTRNGYEVTGLLDPNKDFEIFKEDLDLIHSCRASVSQERGCRRRIF